MRETFLRSVRDGCPVLVEFRVPQPDGAARWLWVADGVPELRRTAYDSAAAGRRMLGEGGWPDAQSIEAALIEPVEAIVVTRLFEERARES